MESLWKASYEGGILVDTSQLNTFPIKQHMMHSTGHWWSGEFMESELYWWDFGYHFTIYQFYHNTAHDAVNWVLVEWRVHGKRVIVLDTVQGNNFLRLHNVAVYWAMVD